MLAATVELSVGQPVPLQPENVAQVPIGREEGRSGLRVRVAFRDPNLHEDTKGARGTFCIEKWDVLLSVSKSVIG
jgi:hypothetical protein